MTALTFTDRLVSTASWLVVVALLWSAGALWISPPTGFGPVGQILGVFAAQIFYSVVYVVEAALLTFAKLTDRMRLRKAALMAIFLTGVFTFGLTITIIGFSFAMLDNMALFALAGICYLYWQIKTSYLTYEEYDAHVEYFGDK